ncbi:hypothetical protein ACL02U_02650 [Streptomyces sp. MS06]|uniref:hypothetical protein n=1 Tax=Streptomyces sp. MS06 TaxID=3385974 RepID=UPI0039A1A5A1
MSETFLSVIPTDPDWQPDQAAGDGSAALLNELCPRAGGEIEVRWHTLPAFVNSGADLETISCPRCGSRLDIREWWMPQMDGAYDGAGFSNLDIRMPCCDFHTTLNDLVYDRPCGFARFEIKILDPDRAELNSDELSAISDKLGHDVRQVWARI